MGAQVGGELELIFLDQVPRFRIGIYLGSGLEFALRMLSYLAFFVHVCRTSTPLVEEGSLNGSWR